MIVTGQLSFTDNIIDKEGHDLFGRSPQFLWIIHKDPIFVVNYSFLKDEKNWIAHCFKQLQTKRMDKIYPGQTHVHKGHDLVSTYILGDWNHRKCEVW